MRAAVFVERDGILNCDRVERNHPTPPLSLDQLSPKTDAIEPLRQLKSLGFLLIATTNQPALSNGNLSRRELDRMHEMLRRIFLLDDIFVCPHDAADFCPCRKPKPGLLTEAAFKWHLNLQQSLVLSNKWQDAEAAHNAGCTSLLIDSPWIGKGHHDIVLPSIAEAVQKITRWHPVPQTVVPAYGVRAVTAEGGGRSLSKKTLCPPAT
ncbi:MAG TPA: HAD hydrolase-like protein [Verrucomicrobiae bacterium]|nr:HAD hydrolase-like protein [Verrucomicrobiae bacterium]